MTTTVGTRDAVPAPRNVAALLDLARAVERAAAERYDRLAGVMASAGDLPLADLFRDLAAEERRHEATVVAMAGGTAAEPQPIASPESAGDDEIADAGGAYLITPHRALDLAAHNERRAFTLFSTIAAGADDHAVRDLAETLAKEELEHLARVRLARRRAWREEQAGGSAQTRRDLAAVGSVDALLVRARAIDGVSRALDESNAALFGAAGDAGTAAMFGALAADAHPLVERPKAANPKPEPPAIGRSGSGNEDDATTDGLTAALQRSLDDAERAFEFYMAVAEQARDQALMETAQALAEQALTRLNRISDKLLGSSR